MMSAFASMGDLTKAMFRLYEEQRFADALEMLTREQVHYPDQRGHIIYWRMCFAALTGDVDQSLRLFADALDQGDWYSETMLRQDSDLQALQGNPAFERLVARNAEFIAQAQENVKPYRIELLPETEPPYPLLVALHGNLSNAAAHVDDWRTATNNGWAVMLPQSTQVGRMDRYVWDDPDWAQREVTAHIETVCQTHPIDRRNVVIGGFSRGALIAAWMALKGSIPTQGFITVAGHFRPEHIDEWRAYLGNAYIRDVGAFLVIGEADTICLPGVRALHNLLTGHDIRSELRVYPGLDHAYPENWETVLAEALDFVTR